MQMYLVLSMRLGEARLERQHILARIDPDLVDGSRRVELVHELLVLVELQYGLRLAHKSAKALPDRLEVVIAPTRRFAALEQPLLKENI